MSSMISERRKLLFVHVPKTAGASITYTLRDLFENGWPDYPHLTVWDLAGSNHDRYFKFMVSRNPWAMCASWHRWHLKHGDAAKSMDVAVRKVKPQSFFGLAAMDAVLRFERLEQDFSALCRAIGIEERPLMRLNESEGGCWRKLYNEDRKRIVQERFALEIEQFGYEF